MLADAVIVGGGIIGCSISYYLAKRGVKVVLVEKNDLASGATTVGQGVIGGGTGLVRASADLYRSLCDQLGRDLRIEWRGGLDFIGPEDDLEAATKSVQEAKRRGQPVQLLTPQEIKDVEPYAADDLLGAIYNPFSGQVNGLRAAVAFADAAVALGAIMQKHTEVTDITVRNGHVEGVVTDRGNVAAQLVVNAAGVWAPFVAQKVGLEIPVIPRRGHILVTESVPRLARAATVWGEYGIYARLRALGPAAKDSDNVFIRQGIAWNMVSTGDDNYIIGTSRDFVGFDRSVKRETIEALAERTVRFFPRFREVNCIRTYSGLREYTPDLHPIMGFADAPQGFVFATGFEGEGIMLGPIVGKLISELIVDGKTSLPIDDYSPTRFTRARQQARQESR